MDARKENESHFFHRVLHTCTVRIRGPNGVHTTYAFSVSAFGSCHESNVSVARGVEHMVMFMCST